MPDKLLGRRIEERSIGAAGGCTSSDLTILPEELIVIENAHRAFTRVVSEVPVRMHSALRAEVLRGANEETEIRCLSPIMHGHISGQRSHAAQQRARNTRHVHNLQEFPMFKCVLVKRCCPTSKTSEPSTTRPFSQLGRRCFSRRLSTAWLRMLDMLLEPRVLLRKCMQDALPCAVPVSLIR